VTVDVPPVAGGQKVTAAWGNQVRTDLLELQTKTSSWVDVKEFGAVGDGVTDDTAAIQAAIDAAYAAGSVTFVSPGTFLLSAYLRGKGIIRGAGRRLSTIKQSLTSDACIDIDSLSDWEVSDLTCELPAGSTNRAGIRIRGEGSNGSVHRVSIIKGGLYVAGNEPVWANGAATVNGRQRQLVLDSVWSFDAVEIGISLESVQGCDLIAPQINGAVIDGVKLLHTCDDVTILGGFATGCGQEGIDAFMGGFNLTIVGFKAFDNTGNGITVKSDDNLYDPGNFQPQGQTTIIGVICRDNAAYGLTIDRQGSTDDPTNWLLSHTTVHGGVFEGNTVAGIKVRARNVSLIAPVCRRNGQQGIHFLPEAMDCDVISPQVSGNGQTTVNVYDGIHVAGTRNRVIGGFSIGKDADSIKNDGDYAGLTGTQRYGVVIASGSTNCEVHNVTAFGNVTGDVVSFGTGGLIRSRDKLNVLPKSNIIGSKGGNAALASLLPALAALGLVTDSTTA
jgi:Pectate lyase superfamily protein